ncbi:MAG TPA: thiol-disulfide oxidoreductase DCC family protein [Candidatus Brocadiaceae bacterium]
MRANRSEPAIFTAILIYDDRCSLCRGCMKWLELHAIRKDAFEFIPCQSDERRKRFPQITDEACQQFLHLVLPNHRILRGDEVLPEIMKRLRGFRWLSFLFKLPVMKIALYAIYRWVANNRYIIAQTIKPLVED